MARRRRNQKRKHKLQKATREKTTNDGLATKRESFLWNNERTVALLNCMTNRKPAGLHKHTNMLLIKSHLSKKLKVDVPIKEIWSFLHSHWNMNEVDEIEYNSMKKIKKKDFQLPQTEEWIRLIKEQGILIKSKNKKKGAMKQTSQAAISNVDLKTLKSVKIMVEKLDYNSMYDMYVDKLLKIK